MGLGSGTVVSAESTDFRSSGAPHQNIIPIITAADCLQLLRMSELRFRSAKATTTSRKETQLFIRFHFIRLLLCKSFDYTLHQFLFLNAILHFSSVHFA